MGGPPVPQALNLYFSTKLLVSRWVQGSAPTPSSRHLLSPSRKAAENVCWYQEDPTELCFSHSPSRTCEPEAAGVGEEASEPGAHVYARQAEGALILGTRAGM